MEGRLRALLDARVKAGLFAWVFVELVALNPKPPTPLNPEALNPKLPKL